MDRNWQAILVTKNHSSNPESSLPAFIPFIFTPSALGEPLTQGLTDVAARRPADPIAHLAQFLYEFSLRGRRGVGSARREPTVVTTAPPVVENQAPPMPVMRPQPSPDHIRRPAPRPHENSPQPGSSTQDDQQGGYPDTNRVRGKAL